VFVDREIEYRFLEEKWHEAGAQCIVLWGKRRVGKTELVKQFIKDKPHIYFLAETTNEKEQLARFSRAIGEFFHDPLLETRGFPGWEESFRYIKEKDEKFVLVIDEFPYLVESSPPIISLFQKAWDEYWSKGKLYLILLGSSMAMMENEVLGYRSPLYGRRTGQWRVDPMSFAAAGQFRRNRDFADRVSHFSVAGGVPAYWLRFSAEKTFAQNVRDHVLRKGEVLYDEVEFILREELREPRYYFALLQAVAQGKRKLSEIVNAAGLAQPAANKYLGVLSDLKIVEREVSVTEEKPLKSKKGLYRITDEFFQFWFKFIFPNRARLEMGEVQLVWSSISRELPQHLGSVYEQIAREVLMRNSQLFFPIKAIGRWWDRNEEIDAVALGDDSILFAEVKWSKNPVGVDVYEALRAKAEKVALGVKARRERFCLFSRSGFTKAMLDRAERENVILFEDERPAVKRG
jgi:AAA+ ATPase superfamily predicted ATPase